MLEVLHASMMHRIDLVPAFGRILEPPMRKDWQTQVIGEKKVKVAHQLHRSQYFSMRYGAVNRSI